jgi:hypothetical protein
MKKTKIIFLLFLFSFNFCQAQSVISDFQCQPGETEGAFWLSWTVPSDIASTSPYQLKYSQGNSIHEETALTYNQNWLPGTVGTKKRELVTGFNPGTEFTFALKWKNEAGNWSALSNAKTCIAPTSTKADNLAPEFDIDNLKSGDTIFEKEDFKIEGWAKDVGGSSVKKVEISFDKKNWEKAISVKNVEGKVYWQYFWKSPKMGEYKIFVRAEDWMDNVSQAKEIEVKVIARQELEKVATSSQETTEKPISEMTAEELKLKIKELQEKIIALLTQLIELLSQKISQIKNK